MSLFGQTKRYTPVKASRRSPLPIFTTDPEKKYGLSTSIASSSTWYTWTYLPLPHIPFSRRGSEPYLNGNGLSSPPTGKSHHRSQSYSSHRPRRYVRVPIPIPPRLYGRIPRFNSPARLLMGLLAFAVFILFLLGFRKRGPRGQTWSPPFVDPSTLVLEPEELAMIWEWEILSGHHPSLNQPPENLPLASTLYNPAIPESLLPSPESTSPLVAYNAKTNGGLKTRMIGVGPERRFVSVSESNTALPGYPPRPMPGAILDLDLLHEKCDFSANKYVRDCIEFLRVGGNMDNGRRVRRGNYLASYKQMYFEANKEEQTLPWTPRPPRSRSPNLSRTPLSLSAPQTVPSTYDSLTPCDPDYPRLFHMFWAGPFTDKPYMAVMSFLFTQNLGLDQNHRQSSDTVRGTCRPQFWVWINPGPAAAVPNPSAKREMYEALATNPWSAPFLHERFRDVVKFKMWNTTEQLDGVDELADHWRAMPIFNSGGNVYKQPTKPEAPAPPPEVEDQPKLGDVLAAEGEAEKEVEPDMLPQTTASKKKKKPTIFEKVGSSSSSESDYDRLSVILSDMARFVLTYRFGGIYLDADTLFLRDWEELWNYRGQFAYRWSWHDDYNTAVLKLHKGSALGRFLFKTALENRMDFHPMTVSKYLRDASLEKLLFRMPDAIFDGAWLNMEKYQRERPPYPYFPDFSVFFSNDKFDTAGAQPSGFDSFFRGSYSYHYHNFWWLPFDPSRNFPDLGQRFKRGEEALREAARLKEALPEGAGKPAAPVEMVDNVTGREDMDDEVDLSWSTVLKRTFEAYLREERPNAYGEYLNWEDQ